LKVLDRFVCLSLIEERPSPKILNAAPQDISENITWRLGNFRRASFRNCACAHIAILIGLNGYGHGRYFERSLDSSFSGRR
jgi:hypothetical protein